MQSALTLDVGLLRNCVRQRTATSSFGGLTKRFEASDIRGKYGTSSSLCTSRETSLPVAEGTKSEGSTNPGLDFSVGFLLTGLPLSIAVSPPDR